MTAMTSLGALLGTTIGALVLIVAAVAAGWLVLWKTILSHIPIARELAGLPPLPPAPAPGKPTSRRSSKPGSSKSSRPSLVSEYSAIESLMPTASPMSGPTSPSTTSPSPSSSPASLLPPLPSPPPPSLLTRPSSRIVHARQD
ncbi:hypothetical protein AMAG_00827 [Allomyces macrogynus ATCC 38327]|uniref:Uncharacterized protein n=1 Tax=Allomyces macrogynus (strain ATCC 38327) TaxID=578462 RepID=A0A0L0RXU6_ALLM3|nr:hypothetical protein AMAG_00827 [Allomyces macrogynus ATCC 38327]|eukprot:KNE54881.1 hypothetical protein AMAG_00827 [Allomyces macrogynus ATCC 38327]